MSISLKINDIIGINTRDNQYLIDYIDENNIKLINSSEIIHYDIIDERINTNTINTLYLLSRTNTGYAEERGYIKNKWIDFVISDITLIGQITNTEEDMIEIKVFPGNEEIYIDFEYKGLPSYLQSIKLREEPTHLDSEEITIEYGDQYMDYIELPDHLQRYGIHSQTHDLLNDLLSTVPMSKRKIEIKKINKIIDRYVKLRETYSVYNDRKEIEMYKTYGYDYKPLVDHILNNKYVDWLVPIINIEKPICSESNNDLIEQYIQIENEFNMNKKQENYFKLLYGRLNDIFTSYQSITDEETVYYNEVSSDMFGLSRIEVYNLKGKRLNYPYLQMFNTEIQTYGYNKKIETLIHADRIPIISYQKLPEYFIDFYKYKNKTTTLLDRSYYNGISQHYWHNFAPYKYKLTEYNEPSELPYSSYVNEIIDSTTTLINNCGKFYSVQDMLYKLEPYLIYNEHLNVEHYDIIKKKIKRNITTYKTAFNHLTDQYISLYNVFNNVYSKPDSIIIDIIQRSEHNYSEKLSKFYNLSDILSSSEHLYNIITYDYANTYMSILSNMNLYATRDIENILKQVLGNTKKDIQDTNKNNCVKINDIYKKIVKNYASKEELMKDNHTPVIINPSNQVYLYNLIINKLYQQDPNIDNDQIDEIINQEKESLPTYVANGHYAILDDGKETTYYKRINNKWVETSMVNENTCITKEDCQLNITKEAYNHSGRTCTSDDNLKFKLKEEMISSMLKEYDTITTTDHKKHTKQMLLILKKHLENLPYLKIYIDLCLFKYNRMYQTIASKAEDIVIVESPYAKIASKVINIEDMSSRQEYIIKFVNEYTREAETEEDEYWLYCLKTNVKLLPTFLYKLAVIYQQNKSDYDNEIERICQDQGTISDDGDRWVDKYSGLTIKIINYDTEEGYDEKGSKLKTRDIIDKDDDVEIKQVTSNIVEYTKNTISVLAENTGVILSKEEILELSENIKKYDIKNQTASLLLIISAYFYTYVQLNQLKPTKTFPTCVASFEGYPIPDDMDNMNGMKYMACVLKGIYGNEIVGKNVEKVIQNLKKIIKYVIDHELSIKLKYSNYVKKEEIIEEKYYDIHWDLFLPPLKDVEITFKPPSQQEINKMTIHEIKSVIIHFSFLIIKGIQTVINKFNPLLLNSKLNPNETNVCCNHELMVVYDFLKHHNKDIGIINDKVIELNDKIKQMSLNTCYLHTKENTLRVLAELPKVFMERTIYQAFITICKINKTTPLINPKLLDYCPNFKVDGLLSLDDQIKLLKEKNIHYSLNQFNELLNILNQQNILKKQNTTSHLREIEELLDVFNLKSININQIGVLSNEYQTKIKSFFMMSSYTSKQKKHIDIYFEQRKKYNTTYTSNEIYVLINYINMIIYTIPYMILNNVEFGVNSVPWKLKISENHRKDLMNHITMYYQEMMKLKSEPGIIEYLSIVMPILERNYVNINSMDWQSHPNINRLLNLYIDYIFIIFIVADKQDNYSRLISKVLLTYIETFLTDLEYVNITQEMINEKIELIERDERNQMIQRLGNMDVLTRALNNVEKNLKLNEWSIGLTKKLWEYDEETYDKIRENDIKRLREERNTEIAKLKGQYYDGNIIKDDSEFNLEDELESTDDDNRDSMEY